MLSRPDVRLLTLVGPPGIGKTRIGLEVAANLHDNPSFAGSEHSLRDGVCFVSLAPISEPDLVVSAIMQALQLHGASSGPLLERLRTYLRSKQMLLLLDNFEQVVAAAPLLEDLLTDCPGVKALVTSRELLHTYGEHNYLVPSLSVPDPNKLPDLQALSRYEAVELFLERARAVSTAFQLTERNARAVAEICLRLDGLPLAIELAAARILVLPPEELLVRLENRLKLLAGGARKLPERHRTLQAAIDWSYNLLDQAEQTLFRSLGMFVGGCTLEAIEQVCGTDLGLDTLDGVTSLVSRSLLQRQEARGASETGGEPRFMMLETIREYAVEKLKERGELDLLRKLHVLYFLKLAEEAEPALRGPDQVLWLNRLEEERDNMRAALEWSYHNDPGVGLRLAAALGTFWLRRGHVSEGKERTLAMLSRARAAGMGRTAQAAKALYTAGFLTMREGDLTLGRSLLEESVSICKEEEHYKDGWLLAEALNILGRAVGRIEGVPARARFHQEALEIAREIGDKWSIARSLYQLGLVAHTKNDYALERAMMEESLSLFQDSGDKFNIGLALIGVGRAAESSEDYRSARNSYEESLLVFRDLGDKWSMGSSLYVLGCIALYEGDYTQAKASLGESLAIARESSTLGSAAESLEKLGREAFFQSDYAGALALFRESLILFRESRDQYGVALCLMNLGGILSVGGKPTGTYDESWGKASPMDNETVIQAGQVLGAAEGLFKSIGLELDIESRKLFNSYVAAVRTQLSEPTFTKAWASGRAMSVEQAVACALQSPKPPSLRADQNLNAPPGARYPNDLSEREVEVLQLIAVGKSNAEIAQELVLSLRTVERHISNIYQKIGATGKVARATATAYALHHGLAT
jgi:predicted ATPase/DNA-binding NarL/FixJ family response regulator